MAIPLFSMKIYAVMICFRTLFCIFIYWQESFETGKLLSLAHFWPNKIIMNMWQVLSFNIPAFKSL